MWSTGCSARWRWSRPTAGHSRSPEPSFAGSSCCSRWTPGGSSPSARLIDALYDEPPRNVDNALQQLVSRLRRILAEGGAPDRVLTRAPGYCLDEPVEAVDALRFERMVAASRTAAAEGDLARAARLSAEALGLWRGPPFAEAALEGDAAVLRTRLAELREAAVDDRVEWELRLGHHAVLVGELEAMVAATPLRERRWGQLMVALYRCGRQGDALQAYQQARRTLADELGVEPGPELRDLERAVLAHDPALAAPAPVRRQPHASRRIPRPQDVLHRARDRARAARPAGRPPGPDDAGGPGRRRQDPARGGGGRDPARSAHPTASAGSTWPR